MLDSTIRSIEGSIAEPEVLAPNIPSSVTDIIVVAEVDDWRTPLFGILENPGVITDRKIR